MRQGWSFFFFFFFFFKFMTWKFFWFFILQVYKLFVNRVDVILQKIVMASLKTMGNVTFFFFFIIWVSQTFSAQSVGFVEYTNCISAEWVRPKH